MSQLQFLKNWASFHLLLSSQLKVTLSFHYRRKTQIHCRVLNGGPIPLKGLTAELHCSCRLYCWWHRAWRNLGGHGRKLEALQPSYEALQDKNHTVTLKTFCRANSTCCSWWRAHSAETQVWHKVSQLSSKTCIKPMSLSYTWVEKQHSKRHWYQLEIICTGENYPFSTERSGASGCCITKHILGPQEQTGP